MSSIDPSELFLAFARSHGGKLFGLAADSVKHVTSIIAANFSNYFEESIRSCIDVHTIFDRSRPLDLRRIYTPVHLAHAEHTQRPKVSDKRFRSTVISLPDYNRIRTFLVIGSAGTGKTMLLKHMFINMIENTAAKIPFYIPLRRYNSFDPAAGMPRFLHKVITNFRAQIDYTVFETEMTNGGFIFLLDGLDEVNPEKRRDVVSQILGLQPRYPKITLVVSSRPDESLALWPLSWPYHILPMEKSEIVSLIRKIPYRTDFKTRFINDLNDGLYEQHESFLSNPLLASIMMLTYSDIGRIPDRMHLFYEQAFETLFYRHDTWKEAGFYRHHYCDIPINRFLDCLSSFCIATYKKTCHEFTKSLALEFIKKAADFEKLNINEEDFFNDMLETVCLLQVDGLYYRFTHRSFQEYFSAVFVSRNLPDLAVKVKDLLDDFCNRPGDAVIQMAMDINRHSIEKEWIMARLKELTADMAKYGTDVVGVCGCLFEDCELVCRKSSCRSRSRRSDVSEGEDAVVGEFILHTPTKNGHFLYVLRKFYPGAIQEPDMGVTNADLAKLREQWIKEVVRREPNRTKAERLFEEWFINKINNKTTRVLPTHNEWLKQTSFGRSITRIAINLQALVVEMESTVRETSVNLFR